MEHSSYCVLHCAWSAGAAYTSASTSQPNLACSSLQRMRLPLYREDRHLLTYLHMRQPGLLLHVHLACGSSLKEGLPL